MPLARLLPPPSSCAPVERCGGGGVGEPSRDKIHLCSFSPIQKPYFMMMTWYTQLPTLSVSQPHMNYYYMLRIKTYHTHQIYIYLEYTQSHYFSCSPMALHFLRARNYFLVNLNHSSLCLLRHQAAALWTEFFEKKASKSNNNSSNLKIQSLF